MSSWMCCFELKKKKKSNPYCSLQVILKMSGIFFLCSSLVGVLSYWPFFSSDLKSVNLLLLGVYEFPYSGWFIWISCKLKTAGWINHHDAQSSGLGIGHEKTPWCLPFLLGLKWDYTICMMRPGWGEIGEPDTVKRQRHPILYRLVTLCWKYKRRTKGFTWPFCELLSLQDFCG